MPQARPSAGKGPHQITLVQQQQHVLVPGIPLEMVFQVLAPGPKRISGIQYLHSKHILPMQKLPKTCFVHQSSQLLCLPASIGEEREVMRPHRGPLQACAPE